MRTRILFLCSRNSCRSQMAEGFARARNHPGIDALSAGSEATLVHPMAVRVMSEVGIDISRYRSKALTDVDTRNIDLVIALCDEAAESCPFLPGNPDRVNWSLPDPAVARGREEQILAAFRESRDMIRRLVDDLFDRGYLDAFAVAGRCANIVLDNVSDGIIAHDLKRRVFHFNRAAEEITGYRRDEVLNRDCHGVFPGNFCGTKCVFTSDTLPEFDVKKREVELVTKGGERRQVEMTVRYMTDNRDRRVGVIAAFRDLTTERRMARCLGEIESFSGIVGRDEKMLQLYDMIHELADTSVPVLIQGESGTGKELVAAAIHNEGPRAKALFVPVNCGALPESLLESELFGHVRGAFTGAVRDKKGRFELANGGTIFLDEIGDISPAMQVKLLRVLQEGRFERVGSEQTIQVDVRVISATNKKLAEELATRRFREDLYYRLNVVPLFLPPLRERRNDVPLLARHILNRAIRDSGRGGVAFSPEAMDILLAYDWPGNVRELQNWIQFALVKCRGPVILPEHLPPSRSGLPLAGAPQKRRRLDEESVRATLSRTNGNKVEAARLLGVSRATLYRFLGEGKLPA